MAIRRDECFCVSSTAIARLFPEANRITTDANTIRFSVKENGKTYRVAYRTPEIVRDYIVDYDGGRPAKPMRFTLTDPQIVEKPPAPKGRARTPSFKPSGPPKTRRMRVFGEKAFRPNEET